MRTRYKIASLCLMIAVFANSAHAASKKIRAEKKMPVAAAKLQELLEEKDDLGARVYLRSLLNRNLSVDEWQSIREQIHRRPNVGFDVIYFWDEIQPKNSAQADLAKKAETQLEKGDHYLLHGKYASAYSVFKSVARAVSRGGKGFGPENDMFYDHVLRSMGRALYSMGRFDEALKVYTWIRPNFPRYREALFEQMWAAFRAGKVDYALGALASQSSAYFSPFLEPEAYLLQIYLYKQLCRQDDLDVTMTGIKEFKKQLHSGQYDYKEWAKSELETRALLQLSEKDPDEVTTFVPGGKKATERTRIRKALEQRYGVERERLKKQVEAVLAYSRLASHSKSKVLSTIDQLPSRDDWFNYGFEIWPADASEDWMDEIGRHRFVGESLCGKK